MKKLAIILIVLCIGIAGQAQKFGNQQKGNGNLVSQDFKTESYDKIVVGGTFDVELFTGKEGQITILMEENLIQFLDINVSNGTLNVKWKNNLNVKTTKPNKIRIPIDKINEIQLTGSGNITSTEILESVKIIVKLLGSGNFHLNLSTNEVEGHLLGSGTIFLFGNTTKEIFEVAGSGTIKSVDLKSSVADARISGSGIIELFVTDSLVGRIAGSGTIYYMGNPKSKDTKVSGSGSIRSK